MYDVVRRLYLAGEIDIPALDKAVTFGWITAEQKAELIEAKINQDKTNII